MISYNVRHAGCAEADGRTQGSFYGALTSGNDPRVAKSQDRTRGLAQTEDRLHGRKQFGLCQAVQIALSSVIEFGKKYQERTITQAEIDECLAE
jgi:hypothetical protein